MLPLVLATLAVLVLVGLVLAYVAWPHRGEEMPVLPQVGDAMSRAVDAVPTLEKRSDAFVPDSPRGSHRA